jgi:hypothetical protein
MNQSINQSIKPTNINARKISCLDGSAGHYDGCFMGEADLPGCRQDLVPSGVALQDCSG